MQNTRRALIVFGPSGKRGRFPLGTRVLQAARELGVDIDSVCGGRARCCRCQVETVEGEFPMEAMVSRAAHLGALDEDEIHERRSGRLGAGLRLACRAQILGDVKIEVPAGSRVHRQAVGKDHETYPVELDPVLRLCFTEVADPGPESPRGDLQRLLQALARDWGLDGLEVELAALQALQAALRDGRWRVTVAIRDQRRVAAVWPGLRERVFGAAVDVGSTTIAVHLCDLSSGEVLASAGAINPQSRYGEDLMSRVSHAMRHPEGAAQMTTAVRAAIDALIREASVQADIEPGEILELTLVGNSVMHHLLLGLDPTPLGSAPFALATDQAVEVMAADLDIHLHPATRAYLLPCIAGHLGADAAAVLLAEKPWQEDGVSLLVDVGTNAEIVLGNRERLLAASCPTGPAFEGAQISCGQRAADGAIERVRIDPETLEPRFKVIGCPLWSDEPGFEAALGGQPVTGVCGSGIIEAVAGMYLAGIIRGDGQIDGNMARRSRRIRAEGRTFCWLLHAGKPAILIRQDDVRAVQLAKAALYAGAQLLMERMGVERVGAIRLAGAFGSAIDVNYAMALGLLPECALAKVSAVGNAAGTGARIALLSGAARREIERRVREVEKVEISTEKNFQGHFVNAMGIPHATQRFPALSGVFDLPATGPRPRKRPGRR